MGRGAGWLFPASLDHTVHPHPSPLPSRERGILLVPVLSVIPAFGGNDEGTCGNDTSSLPLPRHPPLSLRFPRPLRIAKGARRLLATEDCFGLTRPGGHPRVRGRV